MPKQLTIKNHFVPQSYLKRWEDAEQKVSVYKTLVSHFTVPNWKKYSVAAIAYHKHLYTQVLNGNESDELEKWFNREFEAPANCVLDKATQDEKLTKNDWNILIKFLAAQDVRTPKRMSEYLKRGTGKLSEALNEVLDEVKEKLENRDIESLKIHNSPVKDLAFPLKLITDNQKDNNATILKAESYVGRITWIYSIKYLLENTEKVLHKHRWSIVKPAKGYYWITSDNPVVKLNFIDEHNYDFGGGWDKPKGNLFFPIGPEHAMFVQIGDKALPKGTRLSVHQTILIRRLIAENSHRMIFSKNDDDGVTSLKKRTVDKEMVNREKAELLAWHQKNSEMEREYFQ
jgi:hypothetical protein